MKREKPVINGTKSNLLVALVASLLILLQPLILGCRDVQSEIEVKEYLIDPSDATLYRVVNNEQTGKPEEEFAKIQGNPAMKRFACWIDTDRKALVDLLKERCKCE